MRKDLKKGGNKKKEELSLNFLEPNSGPGFNSYSGQSGGDMDPPTP